MNHSISFAVIFDMDGTLLKTEEVALPAFKKTFETLKEEGLFTDKIPDDDDLTGVFGMTLEDIWNKLLPGQSAEVMKKADQLMLTYELEILKQGGVHLYPSVIEMLRKLNKEKIPVFVASNGLDEYIRGVCSCFEMTEYFMDLYSAGRFQTESKDDLVERLLSDFKIERAIMVGDRKSDIQAGKANHLFTVGCQYGFSDEGELAHADVIIKDFKELWPIVERQVNQTKSGLK
ncbi:MAG TPA: HAD hydrolase-like protein [Bacillota bacterium]|nr:HAD hydrolase-like protein [Bacillota bacterium]